MKYDETMIHITDILCESNSMYSIILLDAKSLTISLGGYRCFLDGKYILCLNTEDSISIYGGYYEVLNLRFQPYFYNVNLNYNIIKLDIYYLPINGVLKYQILPFTLNTKQYIITLLKMRKYGRFQPYLYMFLQMKITYKKLL